MRAPKELSWNRVLGVLLMALALGLALDPDYPLPRDEIPSIDVPADLLTKFPVTVAPIGAIRGSLEGFRWNWQGAARSWQVVVLDESTEELFRSPPISGDSWIPVDDELEGVRHDRRLYWYVSSGDGPRRLQSDLQSFMLQQAR